MNVILDKVILFLGCTTLFLFQDYSYAIIPVIIVIILSSLMVYFDNGTLRLTINLSFLLLCIFVPYYIIFLPLILYDIFHTRYQYIALLLPLLIIYHSSIYSASILSDTIIILAFAYWLKYKTDKLSILQSEYNDLRDSSTELSLQLEEKNRSLLKNQDDEIHLAALNERNRISKDIHDNIGHLLSRALLQVGALLTVTKEEVVKEGLTDLGQALSGGMDSIRSSIHQMYDESIDLYVQIDHLVKDFTFASIHFEYDINNPPSLPMKHSMIAIVKEALANIMKHSDATKVTLLFREHPAMYQLIIKDDGTLTDRKKKELQKANEKLEFGDGMGLRNIYDRVKSFHGNLNLIVEDGFTLFITIPKKQDMDR